MIRETTIERCRKNDTRAQREIYQALAPAMLGMLVRYVSDRDAAQDLLHDGFIVLFRKISSYRGEGVFEGWARRLFLNQALQYLRRDKSFRAHSISLDAAGDIRDDNSVDVLAQMNTRDILEVMNRLPTGYRIVLNLYAVEGYSHREISQQLGITEQTSRSQLSRAKAQLVQLLKQSSIL